MLKIEQENFEDVFKKIEGNPIALGQIKYLSKIGYPPYKDGLSSYYPYGKEAYQAMIKICAC